MNLTVELEKQVKVSRDKFSQEIKSEMMEAHNNLIKDNVGKLAIKVGEIFPDFELSNAKGTKVTKKEIFLENKFTIISFYRGGWCPYCNLELKALQDNLDEFKKSDAALVTITPETPDNSLTTIEKNSLTFQVLTDLNSKLAKEINIAFDLPEKLKPIYEKFGIDVKKHNGNITIPIPATFIVDSSGEILFRYVEVDYKKRLDPVEIIKFLKKEL